jgi:hypothetical protein
MKKSQLKQIIKEEINLSKRDQKILGKMGSMEEEMKEGIDSLEQVYNTMVVGYNLGPKSQASLKRKIITMIQNQL